MSGSLADLPGGQKLFCLSYLCFSLSFILKKTKMQALPFHPQHAPYSRQNSVECTSALSLNRFAVTQNVFRSTPRPRVHVLILSNGSLPWSIKNPPFQVLVALRNEMAGPSNRRLPQPPEGTEF